MATVHRPWVGRGRELRVTGCRPRESGGQQPALPSRNAAEGCTHAPERRWEGQWKERLMEMGSGDSQGRFLV